MPEFVAAAALIQARKVCKIDSTHSEHIFEMLGLDPYNPSLLKCLHLLAKFTVSEDATLRRPQSVRPSSDFMHSKLR